MTKPVTENFEDPTLSSQERLLSEEEEATEPLAPHVRGSVKAEFGPVHAKWRNPGERAPADDAYDDPTSREGGSRVVRLARALWIRLRGW